MTLWINGKAKIEFSFWIIIIFLKSKTPSNGTLLGRTSKEVFVVSLFSCWCSSFLIFILLSFVDFLHSHFAFRHHPSPFRGLSPRFLLLILYFQPSPSQSDSQYFHFEPFRYLLTASPTVLSGRFLPTGIFYLTLLHRQPAFIKASLGAGSSSLRLAGLHTDPRNTDWPICLFDSQ